MFPEDLIIYFALRCFLFSSVLNGCTRRGPSLGNSLGVLGKQKHSLLLKLFEKPDF